MMKALVDRILRRLFHGRRVRPSVTLQGADLTPSVGPESAEAVPGGGAPIPDTFCVLAWNHLQIAPNGTVKMCCIAGGDLHKDGRPLNVYVDDYDDIWNSDYMRDARRGMAEGERISPCMRCFNEEDTVGVSRRTTMNNIWRDIDPASLIGEARANDWRVLDRPGFLQLNMGNLCNLGCRMCSSQYSSRIASDAVHSRWIPDASQNAARWRGDRLALGPRPIAGIEMSGFHAYEATPEAGWRWTAGHGVIEFALPAEVRPQSLELELEPGPGADRTLRILVNDTELYNEPVTERRNLSLDITRIGNQPNVKIELVSASCEVSGRELGVLVHDVSFTAARTSRTKSNARALTRFAENSGWWGQPELMFGELLGQPEKLRTLILQGGEPLLIPETEEILDYLIAQNCAGRVNLEIVSNMTIFKPSTFEKLKQFAHVELGGSIDGIAETLEYIRYPASWPEIEKNIQLAATAPNINIIFNVAVQAYNLLDMPNMLSYCDRNGYPVYAHFLDGPYHLSVLTMPRSVRDLAAERIRSFIDAGCGLGVLGAANTILTYLNQHRDVDRSELLRTFMLFTNDLDQSRDQSFAEVMPELHGLIVASGFDWTADTLHLDKAAKPGRKTYRTVLSTVGATPS
jgi:MoaA/NifB/PqqE/SkfB family radical SAM enzyme